MSAHSAAFEHVYYGGILVEGVLVPRIGVRARNNERANCSGDLLVPLMATLGSTDEVPILSDDEISGGNDAGADADMLPVMAEQSHGVRLPVTQASQSAAPSSDNHHEADS